MGESPWQPLSATLTSMGPYDIGVALQSTSAEYNRQAAQVDIVSQPGGPVPSEWSSTVDPYSPYCETLAGTPGTIQETGAILYFHGNGTYTLNVSMYTDAQHNAIPGHTCSGGPTTTATLTVNASPAVRIAGTPLVPRTGRRARGLNGPVLSLPSGSDAYRWRCARDPVVGADGSVTGTATTGSTDAGAGGLAFSLPETDAFTSPGRWACSVQALAGDNPVLSRRITLDRAGRGSRTFTSPRQRGLYLGWIRFGGTAFILPGPDADMFLSVVSPADFRLKPTLRFLDPSAWVPCV